MQRVKDWSEKAASLELGSLSTEQVFDYAYLLWQLDADIFSHYLISQPYRLQVFENEVRWALQKRVAKVKVDEYLAKIVASSEMTENAKEELSWLRLIKDARNSYHDGLSEQILKDDVYLFAQLKNHFDNFKLLNLGDGKWDVDFTSEIKRFVNDCTNLDVRIDSRISEIESQPARIEQENLQLIKTLELTPETVETIVFLSRMSHLRYTMRTNGFIPLIYFLIQMTKELSARLGYESHIDLSFLTPEEIEQTKKAGGIVIHQDEIKRRRGEHDEYLLRINDGKIEYHYGREAGELFTQLVPPVNHAGHTELQGVAAWSGIVTATATVYNWGDDMDVAMESMKSNPILIAGQTRPAMMPLIRLARGIVTDEGGVTSHAAIVARELGIPTIINTGSATKVFTTGELVELNASEGTVRKVES